MVSAREIDKAHGKGYLAGLKKSAEQGNAEAQFSLGMMYYVRGDGVEQNDQEAFKWFRKAARQGNDKAQCWLGLMYTKGYGVEQTTRKPFNGSERPLSKEMRLPNSSLE